MTEMSYLQEVKAVIKSLILSCPEEISVDKLIKDFRETEGYQIPYAKLGFGDLESFLRSMPETIHVNGCGLTARVSSVRNKKTQHMQELVRMQKKPKRSRKRVAHNFHTQSQHFAYNKGHTNTSQFSSHINRRPMKCGFMNTKSVYTDTETFNTKNTVVNNINNHPKSTKPIECHFENVVDSNSRRATEKVQLLNNNQTAPKRIQTDFVSPSKLNFASRRENDTSKDDIVNDLANKFMENFSLKNFRDNQHQQLNADKCSAPDGFDVAVPDFEKNKLIMHLDFPKNAVTCGTKIAPSTVIEEVKEGEIVPIFVSEVYTPLKFWFHIPSKNHPLDRITYLMQNLYSKNPDAHRIFPQCITTGLLCAAAYDDMWHRGEILSPLFEGRAKVFFIDYGTVAFVKATDIKFLHEELAKIPRQALRGSLSHIMPHDTHWTIESANAIVKMTGDATQSARISAIDRNEQIFYMVICCRSVNNKEVIQINKKLMQDRYAKIDFMWREKHIEKTRQSWHRENFPTFSMLESGEYPTLYELWEMMMQGFDYVQTIDEIFFYSGQLNVCKNTPKQIRDLPFQLHITNPFRGDIVMQLKLIRMIIN